MVGSFGPRHSERLLEEASQQMKEMTPEQQLAYATGAISNTSHNHTSIAKKIESITHGQMVEIE
jgi:predicted NodU family carbamoyl transferase